MPFCLTYSRSDNVCKYLCLVSFPLLCYFVVVNSCHLYSLVTCNFVFVLATAIVIDVTVKKARWNFDLIAVIHWVGDPVTQQRPVAWGYPLHGRPTRELQFYNQLSNINTTDYFRVLKWRKAGSVNPVVHHIETPVLY